MTQPDPVPADEAVPVDGPSVPTELAALQDLDSVELSEHPERFVTVLDDLTRLLDDEAGDDEVHDGAAAHDDGAVPDDDVEPV